MRPDCFACQFLLEHLLQNVLVVLVFEIEPMFAIQKAVYVQVFLYVHRFGDLVIVANPIVEAPGASA
jgi:hypothetical protein